MSEQTSSRLGQTESAAGCPQPSTSNSWPPRATLQPLACGTCSCSNNQVHICGFVPHPRGVGTREPTGKTKGAKCKKGPHPGVGVGGSGAVTGGAQDLEQRDRTRSCVRVFALGEGGRSELLPAASDTSPGTERQKDFRALSHLASEVD